jgi:hypothetical protein
VTLGQNAFAAAAAAKAKVDRELLNRANRAAAAATAVAEHARALDDVVAAVRPLSSPPTDRVHTHFGGSEIGRIGIRVRDALTRPFRHARPIHQSRVLPVPTTRKFGHCSSAFLGRPVPNPTRLMMHVDHLNVD